MNYEYEYEKYKACDSESIKTLLDKYGVVIIPNVLNKEEQNNMMNGMWDMFEHLTQKWTKSSDDDDYRIKRYDKNSWLSLFDLREIATNSTVKIEFVEDNIINSTTTMSDDENIITVTGDVDHYHEY